MSLHIYLKYLFVWTLLTNSFLYGSEHWIKASIPNVCTFEFPNTMEIQKGRYKTISDAFMDKVLEFLPNSSRIIIQQKGLNKFNKKSFKSYARIIVETDFGQPGDYENIDSQLTASKFELRELDSIYKEEMERGIRLVNSKNPSVQIRVVSWQSIQLVTINGISMIKLTYTRRVNDNPFAVVNMYLVQNYDKMHTITISYRYADKKLWKKDLNRVIYSFKFK